MQVLKQSLEHQRKDLNDCRAEITSLKMHIEGYRSGRSWATSDVDDVQSQSLERYKEEIKSLQMEMESLKAKNSIATDALDSSNCGKESIQGEENVVEIHEDKTVISHQVDTTSGVLENQDAPLLACQTSDDNMKKPEEVAQELLISSSSENGTAGNVVNAPKQNGEPPPEESEVLKSDNIGGKIVSEKTASS